MRSSSSSPTAMPNVQYMGEVPIRDISEPGEKPTATPPLLPTENRSPCSALTVNSPTASPHPRVVSLRTPGDETSAVEAILLSETPEEDYDCVSPPTRTPVASVTPSSLPFISVIRRTLCLLLIAAIASCAAIFIVAQVSTARYFQLLPAFCRWPGMEPYRHTSHCLDNIDAGLGPTHGVSADRPLLDGPPPSPIYWADFQELYELQRRMIYGMRSAFVFEDTIVLQFINDEVYDQQSALHHLRMEVQQWDYMKERVLRDTLYKGARLGRKLHGVWKRSKGLVRDFAGSNDRAAQGIEENMLKQPQGLAAFVAPFFPRRRSHRWTWATDIEVRYQFYRSLTLFSEELYENLLVINALPSPLEGLRKDVISLHSLLMKKENDTQAPSADTIYIKPPAGFTWYKTARPKEDVPAADLDADNDHEAVKKALLDRFEKDVTVALDRANTTLRVLRALGEDVETMRRRVASPQPDSVPLFIYLRHIYAEGGRLNEMLRNM
ncbi:hypothetical protein NMY22_g2099 [Coprinellus aureogranulatus]|nr:hypothetical protein NMY22_g2099 [Coprinellus aureogranulatus]